MLPDTFSVTFTYSTQRGVFTGHFANGVSFDFIAASDTFPTKLRNALHALARREHTQFKRTPRPTSKENEAEFERTVALIRDFEARNGVTRSTRVAKRRGPPTLSLEDIDL